MTIATGIAFCQRYLGFPYSIAPSRFGLTRPVHFDCSGYAWRYCDEAGTPLPKSVSTTFAMVAYAEDNPHLGLIVTREFATTHEGVLCLRGGRVPSGKNGSGGHVAVSDGQGGTYEAQGRRTGVLRGVIGNRFDFFMVPPGYRQPAPDDPFVNNRKWFPMWLIQDSRTDAVYAFNGVTARYLDPESYRIQVLRMKELGLPTEVKEADDYEIDRLREAGAIYAPRAG